MFVINYLKEDILEKKHICFYTKQGIHGDLELWEILEYTIKHPEAPEYATIKQFENELVKSIRPNDNSNKHAYIHLMNYAQHNCIDRMYNNKDNA